MAERTLLMLHGLGATSGVWADVQAELDWPGRVVAPDLAGHGSAPWSGDYTVGALAAAASAVLEANEPTVIVGHSLGGGVGLALASGFFRPAVHAVLGLGIKTSWSEADVAGMAAVAAKGVRWVDDRDGAITRFRRNAGLDGLIADDHPAVTDAVVEDGGRWRVAQDPATFAQQPLDMVGLMAAAQCPVALGAGEHDAMAAEAELARFTDAPRIAAGRGHNVQTEDPGWVVAQLRDLVATLPG
ncbi:MAG: alpha/beta fold hydrolase [Actinomycetota bacterium]